MVENLNVALLILLNPNIPQYSIAAFKYNLLLYCSLVFRNKSA